MPRYSKARRRNARYIRNLMLQPKTNKYFNTAEIDYPTLDTKWQIFTTGQSLEVGTMVNHAVVLPGTMNEIANVAAMKGRKFVCGSESNIKTYQNTSNHTVDLQFFLFTPKLCIGEELFTDYGITLWDWPALIGKLMDKDDPSGTITDQHRLYGFSPAKSHNVRKFFRILKRRNVCMGSGDELTVKLYGKRNCTIDGDLIQDVGSYQFFPGVHQFYFIRARGGMVHDTVNDAFVGSGPVHLNLFAKSRRVYYALPSDKREMVSSYNTDTIGTGQAPTRADIQMEDVKEE